MHAAIALPAGVCTAEIVATGPPDAKFIAAWDDLVRHASEPNPFYEPWFLTPALKHLAGANRPRLLVVRKEDQLLALVPLTVEPRYGRMPIRHVENWLHYHCFYGAPLVRAGFEHDVWHAILDLLDRSPWADGLLHLKGLDPDTQLVRALMEVRRADVVHRTARALLSGPRDPQTYFATHVRKKKRKELARLRARLGELGTITCDRLAPGDKPQPWIEAFLALEASGWKGRAGSALGSSEQTSVFLRDALTGAHAAGRLELLRLTLDGQPIAMLVNFLTAPGGFSFKIAFDERFARFSPGVMIQIENLATLARDGIDWMDSCAAEDHPMINSLWAGRRPIVRVTIPLNGVRRRLIFASARALETVAARIRALR